MRRGEKEISGKSKEQWKIKVKGKSEKRGHSKKDVAGRQAESLCVCVCVCVCVCARARAHTHTQISCNRFKNEKSSYAVVILYDAQDLQK